MYDFSRSEDRSRYRRSKEFKAIKEKLFTRYDYRCYICDMKHKKGLHPHHINPDSYGRETLDDLIPLCSSCHKLVERILSRTKNKIDIDKFCQRLKDIIE